MKKAVLALTAFLVSVFCLQSSAWSKSSLLMMVTPVLTAGQGTVMAKKEPSLALMAAKGTDKIDMAWVPGSDGKTPVEQIKYEIHLSSSADFTPSTATLKKTVIGTSQAELSGLVPDTLYYGKIIARYSNSSSNPSNELQTKTFKNAVQLDPSATIAVAADLGLGKHTTSDGITYTYAGNGTPPIAGSILFSEDALAGGMTLRKVDFASKSGSTVTVQTSEASLTDAVDRGSISNSFQLFDVAAQATNLPVSSGRVSSAKSFASADGSQHSRMEWKNKLLAAEQTNYAYNEENFSVTPKGRTSLIKLKEANAIKESFTVSVTPKFEPKLITEVEWGGSVAKHLDSAKVAAKGKFSLTALAEYNFSAEGTVTQEPHQIWNRSFDRIYWLNGIPIHQKIILTLKESVSASASAKIKATAKAQLSETVEVGATYDGLTWTPYIIHEESKMLVASLDIAGKASAEIRLIPEIEVKFYPEPLLPFLPPLVEGSSSLSIEPIVNSVITVKKTTDNFYFLTAHPDRLIQLASFDGSLGVEANVKIGLAVLGKSWTVLPSTCVLGTGGDCLYSFDPLSIFSIPQLKLSYSPPSCGSQIALKLQAIDGVNNPFNPASINWEVFPNDGKLSPISCSKSEKITTCTAAFEPGTQDKYTVFVSGYSILLEPGRQFKELTLGPCALKPQTVIWKGQEWQHCNDGELYNWEEAKAYCHNLVLDCHSDWRLPTKDELKGLVVCTNGTPTPLNDEGSGEYPQTCDDGNSAPYRIPTIDPSFECVRKYDWDGWWTSTVLYNEVQGIPAQIWGVGFIWGSGSTGQLDAMSGYFVRCVR